MNKTILEILDFLTNQEDGDDYLCELVEKDLNINVDYDCSNLIDNIEDKVLNVSFKDIIKAVKNRIIIAINTFE